MKILITDNDFESVEDISVALNLCIPDLELTVTNSGGQCLDIVRDRNPDIVLLGLKLSEIDCFDIIRRIRASLNIPILVISYKKDEQGLIKAVDLGANDYMIKPVKPLELIARIKKLVEDSECARTKTRGINRQKTVQ